MTVEEQRAARYYYDGEDRLAVAQRYVYLDGGVMAGAWEEVRYDALGRRVVTRVRREGSGAPGGVNPLCTSIAPGVCGSYVERTWWDGKQILVETRSAEGAPDATRQGQVGYVHGLTIDQPVAVLTDAGARVINYSWRGLAESSLWANGSPGDCSLGAGGCTTVVSWPSGRGAYFTPYLGGVTVPSSAPTWLGSLTQNGAGGTGLLYRRNRYYDPQSGRFTQQDPIGVAGGLNVYAFAGGDPVSYSDPFGLCPEDVSAVEAAACVLIEGSTAILGSVAGFIAGGGGGALAAVPTAGFAAPVTVPAGAVAGAGIGGVAGKLAGEAITNTLFSRRSGGGGGAEDGGLSNWARGRGLNASSPTTQNLFNNRGMKVSDFIAKFRKGNIREVFPGEFMDRSLDEALRQGGSTVRKLLIDGRFVR